jgi:hypothetical protein
MKIIWIPSQNLDSKEKNLHILLDIGVGLGSEMNFKSRELDFNEFPILERFKPFLNRKFVIWSKDSNSNIWLRPKSFLKIKGKDLNFKRRFIPIDLNLVYFIEFKEDWVEFEWIWVNWT